uniref:Large ribosomal subunit protein uL3c n=1 Tax=Sporolithon durum TaxID=48970 RepID=A0A141SD97_9FLOR|nr:ribosomal protein L3 [Sporolithon durum]AMK96265.1 ribosomal protein L3 [Sporolithon durum]
MSIGLLGTKIGMTQIFDNKGNAIPVTVLQLGPCLVTQIKNKNSDKYNAIQIGYEAILEKKLSKAQLGHLNKNKLPSFKYLKEYRVTSPSKFEPGQPLTVNKIKIGSLIDVSSRSISKGFTGYQKRHHFSRGPMSHGCKNHRKPGSIGAGTTPGRVFPGKKMAGKMGNKKTTIRNLKVIDIKPNNHIVIIKGSVPGKAGSIVSIKIQESKI